VLDAITACTHSAPGDLAGEARLRLVCAASTAVVDASVAVVVDAIAAFVDASRHTPRIDRASIA
jgi:hypothetical protein